MLSISAKEFLFWKKKQLSKGGDHQSFDFLIDCIGGVTTSEFNLSRINTEDKLYLNKKIAKIKNYLANCLRLLIS